MVDNMIYSERRIVHPAEFEVERLKKELAEHERLIAEEQSRGIAAFKAMMKIRDGVWTVEVERLKKKQSSANLAIISFQSEIERLKVELARLNEQATEYAVVRDNKIHEVVRLKKELEDLKSVRGGSDYLYGLDEGERRALERMKDAYLLHCKKWGVEPVHFLSELGLGEEEKR